MLKQTEIDCEKNIIFGYCCKGTISVKKQIEYICKMTLKALETTKKMEYIFISFCVGFFFNGDVHTDCILDTVSSKDIILSNI